MRKLLLYICFFCSFSLSAAANCRYQSVEGQYGTTLLNSLHTLILPHTQLTYSGIIAYKTGADVVDGYVVDMYSNCSFKTNAYCYQIDRPECDCYNREHMLPKSWWGSPYSKTGTDTAAIFTDLFNVIPADYVANEKRSAWIYDEVKTTTWTNNVSKLGSSINFSGETAFEPSDEYKGDIARSYFYLITCYNYMNFTQGGKGFKFFQSGTAKLNATALTLLLKWHRNDPVSDRERDRNNVVEKKQGNRNPFIDDPSLVEHIWGNKKTLGYKCTTTDLEEPTTLYPLPSAPKLLINGRLYLLHEGTLYTPQGQPVSTNFQSSITNE